MNTLPSLEIKIEDRAGNAVGEGPLSNVPFVRYYRELGAAGWFESMIPLRDERVDLLQEKSHLLKFIWNNKIVFVGVLEETGVTVDNAGVLMVPVSGRCWGGAELSEAKIGFLELTDGSGGGVNDGPADILTASNTFTPSNWTLDSTDGYTTTSTNVYAKFAGESALQALRKVASKIGEHWRFHETDRKIIWLRTNTPDSEIRAISGAPDMVSAQSNPAICFFQTFEERKDVHGLFNRIYPYGGGAFEIAVTLNSTTRSAASGFTLSTANNYLQNDNSISDLGLTIPLYVQFPDIRPVSNTDADIQSAANMLFDAAEAMLERHDTVSDFQVYDLDGIVNLPDDVKVGTTIKVVYEDERYNVNTDLIVLGIQTDINADASVVHSLTVAQVDQMPPSSTESIVNSMADGRVFQTHPILNVNSYETGYTKYVFDDGVDEETAKIYFDFDDEVTQIQQVVLKFETAGSSPVGMLPLESTVRSVGGTATTTGAVDGSTTTGGGGGTTETTGGGSSHSHTVTISGHQHEININQNVNTGYPDVKLNTDAESLEHTGGATGYTVTTNSTTGTTAPTSTSESTHTHSITLSDHTHDFPHQHEFTSSISAEYGLFRESTANTFQLADLRYRINGGSWSDLDADAVQIGSSNRYSLDITNEVYDSDFRPVQTTNTLEIARKSSGTFASRQSCTFDGVLKIRCIIQSTAVA